MLVHFLERLLAVRDIPEPPPLEPFALLARWFDDARASGRYDDPDAMALATADAHARPSVRVVLCKQLDPVAGALVFYTNYDSRKGRDLAANPHAAAVFHWPHARRQARVEGPVERLSPDESDAYFRTRPLLSRLGAAVSRQSTVIESRAALIRAAMRVAQEAATDLTIPRPADWGGFRLRAREVELWSGCDGRLHQRYRWRREAPPTASTTSPPAGALTPLDQTPWRCEALAP